MGGGKRRTLAEKKVRELREALRRQEQITQRLASLAGIPAAAAGATNSGNGAPRRLQHKLFIGNIESVTEEGLERAFSRYGEISEVWVAKNPPGFGFVEFKRRRDAIDACQQMDDRAVFSSKIKIRVEFAKAGGGNTGGNKARQVHAAAKSKAAGKPSNVQPLMEVKVVPKLLGSGALGGFLSSVVTRQSPSSRGGEREIRPLMEGFLGSGGNRGNRDSGRRRSVTPRRDRSGGRGWDRRGRSGSQRRRGRSDSRESPRRPRRGSSSPRRRRSNSREERRSRSRSYRSRSNSRRPSPRSRSRSKGYKGSRDRSQSRRRSSYSRSRSRLGRTPPPGGRSPQQRYARRSRSAQSRGSRRSNQRSQSRSRSQSPRRRDNSGSVRRSEAGSVKKRRSRSFESGGQRDQNRYQSQSVSPKRPASSRSFSRSNGRASHSANGSASPRNKRPATRSRSASGGPVRGGARKGSASSNSSSRRSPVSPVRRGSRSNHRSLSRSRSASRSSARYGNKNIRPRTPPSPSRSPSVRKGSVGHGGSARRSIKREMSSPRPRRLPKTPPSPPQWKDTVVRKLSRSPSPANQRRKVSPAPRSVVRRRSSKRSVSPPPYRNSTGAQPGRSLSRSPGAGSAQVRRRSPTSPWRGQKPRVWSPAPVYPPSRPAYPPSPPAIHRRVSPLPRAYASPSPPRRRPMTPRGSPPPRAYRMSPPPSLINDYRPPRRGAMSPGPRLMHYGGQERLTPSPRRGGPARLPPPPLPPAYSGGGRSSLPRLLPPPPRSGVVSPYRGGQRFDGGGYHPSDYGVGVPRGGRRHGGRLTPSPPPPGSMSYGGGSPGGDRGRRWRNRDISPPASARRDTVWRGNKHSAPIFVPKERPQRGGMLPINNGGGRGRDRRLSRSRSPMRQGPARRR